MSDVKPPVDEPASTGVASAKEDPATPQKAGTPPTPALVFVIIALLCVLLLTFWRNSRQGGQAGDSDIAALQSEIDARREELNRQRIAIGLSPVQGGGEPVVDISSRLKKDAESLVALAGRFQEMLSEKDREIITRNSEILRAEKLRQSLAAESSRLQQELQRALVLSSDAEQLRKEMNVFKAQRDAVMGELALAREKLANLNGAVPAEEFAILKRRLEETERAKDFFEARVKEIEGKP